MSLRLAVLAALVASTAVAAQPGGVYVLGLADRASFDGPALAAFADTYSAHYAARIAEPLAPFPADATALGLGAMGRIRVGSLAVGIGYSLAKRPGYDETADLGAVGQRFTLDVWDHTVWIEGTLNVGPVFVGGVVNGVLRGERLRARTVYADGSESIGTDMLLNGVYHGTTSANEAGLVVGVALGNRVVIPVRWYLVRHVPAEDSFSDPLNDEDVYELNSAFPRDFGRFTRDRLGLDFDNAMGGNDFLGRRLQVGVEIRLL